MIGMGQNDRQLRHKVTDKPALPREIESPQRRQVIIGAAAVVASTLFGLEGIVHGQPKKDGGLDGGSEQKENYEKIKVSDMKKWNEETTRKGYDRIPEIQDEKGFGASVAFSFGDARMLAGVLIDYRNTDVDSRYNGVFFQYKKNSEEKEHLRGASILKLRKICKQKGIEMKTARLVVEENFDEKYAGVWLVPNGDIREGVPIAYIGQYDFVKGRGAASCDIYILGP